MEFRDVIRLVNLTMLSGMILKWIINQMAWKPLEIQTDHRETKLVQQEYDQTKSNILTIKKQATQSPPLTKKENKYKTKAPVKYIDPDFAPSLTIPSPTHSHAEIQMVNKYLTEVQP